jgi:hypothetical protein
MLMLQLNGLRRGGVTVATQPTAKQDRSRPLHGLIQLVPTRLLVMNRLSSLILDLDDFAHRLGHGCGCHVPFQPQQVFSNRTGQRHFFFSAPVFGLCGFKVVQGVHGCVGIVLPIQTASGNQKMMECETCVIRNDSRAARHCVSTVHKTYEMGGPDETEGLSPTVRAYSRTSTVPKPTW